MESENEEDHVPVLNSQMKHQITKVDHWDVDGDRLLWLVMSGTSFSLRIMAIIGFALALIDVIPYVWILPVKAMTLLILAKFIDHTKNDMISKSNENNRLENHNV